MTRQPRRPWPEIKQATFAAVEAAALAGERCPMLDQGLNQRALTELAREGKLAIEISARNWRRVTIQVGPNAGKSTAGNPLPKASVYLTIDKSGTRRSYGRLVDSSAAARPKPSLARLPASWRDDP